jgi:hypothetical protein
VRHVRLIASGRHARIETGREEFHVYWFDGDRPVAGYDSHAFRFGSAEHTVLMMRRELDASFDAGRGRAPTLSRR